MIWTDQSIHGPPSWRCGPCEIPNYDDRPETLAFRRAEWDRLWRTLLSEPPTEAARRRAVGIEARRVDGADETGERA
jgi:hypothetical protein